MPPLTSHGFFPQDEEDLADMLLGPMDGEPEPEPEEEFGASPFELFAERSAPSLPEPRGRRRGFLSGLLVGGVRGLQSRGEKVAKTREKFETGQKERRTRLDLARIKSTAEMKRERGQTIRTMATEQRSENRRARERREEYERDNPLPTDDDLKQFPHLARIRDPEGRIPRKALADAVQPKEKKEDDFAPNLSSAGLDLAARQYATMGTLPPMGMGKAGAGIRTKIINRAAELNPNLNLAEVTAGYQSDKATLTNVKRIRDAAEAFAQTADKNATVLEEAMKKIPDTKVPWLNRPIRTISRNVLGSADLAAFDAARQTVIPEFARLLASPTASGQLTDSARREIEHVVRGDYSVRQMMAAIAVLRRDANNRRTSYDNQIKEIEGRIRSRGTVEEPGGAGSRVPPPTPDFNPTPGGFFDANRPGGR